ncbi:bacterio-opsin activator domain-containing protein [Halosolutus amylolyticus]|uniref:Bacterio-opsin activator domain-containing protein n=1 Tax=Halosolutus amylolyticus TaxID=2932267 RepID=A0ABD5PNN6_9EURY|nr:bacterio-opsin activator domain-containing protein [Halosolutus amylolyticus]
MSVIATIEVPSGEFPLGSLFDVASDATVTVETTVPASDVAVPYFWVPIGVTESLVEALESDPNVVDAVVVDETDTHVLVKVTWTDRVNGVLQSIRESNALVTSAAGTADSWTFRLRFPSSAELSAFYARCLDQGISIELIQLHEAVSPNSDCRFGLTAPQRELVLRAYEAGYFEVPRKTTLVELADRFDISDSAVSQRLRRGLATLVDSTLRVDPESSPHDVAHIGPDPDAGEE